MNAFKNTFALLACAGAASVCSAAAVRVTFDNPIFSGSGSDSVQITFPKQAPAGGSTTLSVAAGRFQGTASNVVGVLIDLR